MTILSLQERQFKQTSSVDQLAVHFSLDGNLLHKESEEARKQLVRLGLSDHKEGESKDLVVNEIAVDLYLVL